MQHDKLVSVFIKGNNTNKLENLMLKVALHYAQNGLRVWCIASKTFDKIPKTDDFPVKDTLKSITFLFLKDYKALITHLNGIHLWHKKPDMMIVLGFESYCNFDCFSYSVSLSALITTSIIDSCLACPSQKMFLLTTCLDKEEYKDKLTVLEDLYFSKRFNFFNENVTFNQILDICG